jgi:hypothetical protein
MIVEIEEIQKEPFNNEFKSPCSIIHKADFDSSL